MSTPLITPDLVAVDLVATDRDDATRQLIDLLAAAGRVTDADGFHADVRAREAQMATGMPGGIGLPHARSEPRDRAEPGGRQGRRPASTSAPPTARPPSIFLIAAPDAGDGDHLKILAALARRLVHESFRTSLKDAADAATVAEIVTREVVPS